MQPMNDGTVTVRGVEYRWSVYRQHKMGFRAWAVGSGDIG